MTIACWAAAREEKAFGLGIELVRWCDKTGKGGRVEDGLAGSGWLAAGEGDAGQGWRAATSACAGERPPR